MYDTLLADYSPLNRKEETKTTEAPPPETATDENATEKKPEKKKLGMKDDEVVAVIGHELGHWKLSHNIYNIIISEVSLLFLIGESMGFLVARG